MQVDQNEYAPVFIPTLCRYEHFKRCVDSLSRCTGAEYTTLIIGLDYPLNESHWEGYRKIKDYILSIQGFKKVIVLERPENYGALKNGEEAFKYIYKQYDKLILSEDDNEFSPNFLEYINKGLIIYKEDPRVIAICGYMSPHDHAIRKGRTFLCTGYSAWGTGLWREKHLNIRKIFNIGGMGEILFSWKKSLYLFMISPKDLNSLLTMYTKKLIWGDVLIVSNNILNAQGSIMPSLSKVRNWGNDGSGLHSKIDKNLSTQEIDENENFDYNEDSDSLHLINYTPHRLNLWIKCLILIRYLLYRFTHKDLLAYHYKNVNH